MSASHESRIHSAVNAFEEANGRMVRLLETLSDEAAGRAPAEGGWNAAQVGLHVATTTELVHAERHIGQIQRCAAGA